MRQRGIRVVGGLFAQNRLIEARRKNIDEIDVAGELIMLLPGNARRYEDAKVTDGFVHRVDDGLPVPADIVDAVIEIGDPPQCLLRWRDVIPLRAEDDDRGTDGAQIDPNSVARDNLGGRQLVSYEQIVDYELHLFAGEEDVAAPPFFELQVTRRLGVDFGEE